MHGYWDRHIKYSVFTNDKIRYFTHCIFYILKKQQQPISDINEQTHEIATEEIGLCCPIYYITKWKANFISILLNLILYINIHKSYKSLK